MREVPGSIPGAALCTYGHYEWRRASVAQDSTQLPMSVLMHTQHHRISQHVAWKCDALGPSCVFPRARFVVGGKIGSSNRIRKQRGSACKPAIAQLVEHLTVEPCSYQMVPGSIPGGRTFAQADPAQVVGVGMRVVSQYSACVVSGICSEGPR